MGDNTMAYYDYFKNIKPVYKLPSYGDVQGGVQSRAIGTGGYRPYSETVRAQAQALPGLYGLAQQRAYLEEAKRIQEAGLDIERGGLELAGEGFKQERIEAENLQWQEQHRLDVQEEQDRKRRLLEYAGLGITGLASTAPLWAPPAYEGLKALAPHLAPAAPWLAPLAIAGTWGYGLHEATKGRSKGQTARAIAEGSVGDYTPAIEAVNLRLIKDYDMNKTAYGRVGMQEIDKLIMQYGDAENLGMLYNSVLELLKSRAGHKTEEELRGFMPEEDIAKFMEQRKFMDYSQEEKVSAIREMYPGQTWTTEEALAEAEKRYPENWSQEESIAGAVTETVRRGLYYAPPGEKVNEPAIGWRSTDVTSPSGRQSNWGFDQLWEELYGEPYPGIGETEEEPAISTSKTAISAPMGSLEEREPESVRQKVAIGRL